MYPWRGAQLFSEAAAGLARLTARKIMTHPCRLDGVCNLHEELLILGVVFPAH